MITGTFGGTLPIISRRPSFNPFQPNILTSYFLPSVKTVLRNASASTDFCRTAGQTPAGVTFFVIGFVSAKFVPSI